MISAVQTLDSRGLEALMTTSVGHACRFAHTSPRPALKLAEGVPGEDAYRSSTSKLSVSVLAATVDRRKKTLKMAWRELGNILSGPWQLMQA